jgi:hypothetical protein
MSDPEPCPGLYRHPDGTEERCAYERGHSGICSFLRGGTTTELPKLTEDGPAK